MGLDLSFVVLLRKGSIYLENKYAPEIIHKDENQNVALLTEHIPH